MPLTNPRYALNAANARWGSLYDALYGTDAITKPGASQAAATIRNAEPSDRRGRGPQPDRAPGRGLACRCHGLRDRAWPAGRGARGRPITGLRDHAGFGGWRGPAGAPSAVLLRHQVCTSSLIDRAHPIGKDDPAGVADVVLESALTTIMDCEDCRRGGRRRQGRRSTATGRPDAAAPGRKFDKGGRPWTRRLHTGPGLYAAGGRRTTLPGRSLMLSASRPPMTTDAVLG